MRLFARGAAILLTIASAGAVAGCDRVFAVPPPVDAIPLDVIASYDRCAAAPILDDDPLRYHVLTNPNKRMVGGSEVPAPWPWDQARSDCQRFGMDLIVINDARELGKVDEQVPTWIGQRRDAGAWSAVDSCEPFTNNAVGREGMSCGIVETALTITTTSCDGKLPPMPPDTTERLVHFALCEAPRPTTEDCIAKDPGTRVYTVSQRPLSRDDARAFCTERGAQLAEVDSHAEWLRVARLTHDRQRRYWMSSTFDGTTWQTESTCPMLYSWVGNTVGEVPAGMCLATQLAEDVIEGGLRLDGVTPTDCNDGTVFALCEQ